MTNSRSSIVFTGLVMCSMGIGDAAAAIIGGWDPDYDQVLMINQATPFTLDSANSVAPRTITFQIYIPLDETKPRDIVGFSFAGYYIGLAQNTWASDTKMTVTAPNGVVVAELGGFPAPPNMINHWDFQGGGSEPDGAYFHGVKSPHGDGKPHFFDDPLEGKEGWWTFEFEQTFGAATWKGVVINLHKLPAPGSLAVLGLAGLLGSSRRRE